MGLVSNTVVDGKGIGRRPVQKNSRHRNYTRNTRERERESHPFATPFALSSIAAPPVREPAGYKYQLYTW